MFKTIRKLFEQRRVKIPVLGDLIKQLQVLKAEWTDEGKLKVRTEDAKVHDDYADSFALACTAVSSDGDWHMITIDKHLQKSMFG